MREVVPTVVPISRMAVPSNSRPSCLLLLGLTPFLMPRQVQSGPSSILKLWPPLVRLSQLAESSARQALKDKPKESKITVATLTGHAELKIMRKQLQAAKAAANVVGAASVGYIFAWKDESLAKKRFPAEALVLFLVSREACPKGPALSAPAALPTSAATDSG